MTTVATSIRINEFYFNPRSLILTDEQVVASDADLHGPAESAPPHNDTIRSFGKSHIREPAPDFPPYPQRADDEVVAWPQYRQQRSSR